METHDDPTGPSVESDGLAFFYGEAQRMFEGLRDDTAQLARRASRVARAVLEDGCDPTEQERADFHRACELAERSAALTFRLLKTLDIG